MSRFCTKKAFCDRLDERLNPEANHGKGLTQVTVFYMESGKAEKKGVMYKTKASDQGLMVHFCPWCGVNLYRLFGIEKKSKTTPTKERADA